MNEVPLRVVVAVAFLACTTAALSTNGTDDRSGKGKSKFAQILLKCLFKKNMGLVSSWLINFFQCSHSFRSSSLKTQDAKVRAQ